MNILLTNDDSVESEGIWILREELIKNGHNVFLVAPSIEKSATSHALTIREPLRIKPVKNPFNQKEVLQNAYSVSGTPVDCIIIAFEEILKNQDKIDLVISGINAGQNLGDDLLYSGTVAAAIEAMCFGYKAIAISTTSYENQKYAVTAKVLNKLINKGIEQYIGHREILNINVPNIDETEIKGLRITQVGFRRYQNILFKDHDHRNREIFWIGGDNPIFEKSEHCLDFEAVKDDYVSISPVKIDFTNYDKLNKLETWLTIVGDIQ